MKIILAKLYIFFKKCEKFYVGLFFAIVAFLCHNIIGAPVEVVTYQDTIPMEAMEMDSPKVARFIHYHNGFVVCYNGDLGIPEYVTYTLTKEQAEESEKKSQRTNDFRQCPQIKYIAKISATHNDYTKSGYDRGHLCPNNDRDYSLETASETFHMCNVAPQTHAINAGVWKKTEELGHKLAKKYGKIDITAGVIFYDEPKRFTNANKNKIAIPDAFFKVYFHGEELVDAYIIPNKSTGLKGFNTYKTTLDEIQKVASWKK